MLIVSDYFLEDLRGGAELSLDALIQASPQPVTKIRSRDLTQDQIKGNILFGNFAELDFSLDFSLCDYSVIEFDFKYCKWRSPDWHISKEGFCDCATGRTGQVIGNFLNNAKKRFWMSEKQFQHYSDKKILRPGKDMILSSVFSLNDLDFMRELRYNKKRSGCVAVGGSWVKGGDSKVELLKDLEYYDLLKRMSRAEKVICKPNGMDTCPRVSIEAKLLGCELETNEYVLHRDEEWFQTVDSIEDYLYNQPKIFWHEI